MEGDALYSLYLITTQELSILPNCRNGKLLQWVDKMADQGVCEKTVPKMRKFLLNGRKMKLFQLELIVVGHVGKGLKARNTKLEGDTFEFLHCYEVIAHMGEALKKPITPELEAEIVALATDIVPAATRLFASAPAPAAPAPAAAPALTPTALQVLESLQPSVFKTVNIDLRGLELLGVGCWPRCPAAAVRGEADKLEDQGRPHLDPDQVGAAAHC